MEVTRADELVTIAQGAQLCGVEEVTIRNWISRGYYSDAMQQRVRLPIAKRDGRTVLLDPVELAKAEHATARRARRASAAMTVGAYA